jgi:4-carboxymuconolactone decarboxylase
MTRINPIPPAQLTTETRYVHDEIYKLISRSQGQVNMIDDQGALLGPFPPMLQFPQFGIPALTFIQSLDLHATLDKRLREVAILTVGGAYGSRFILFAHEIMAAAFGIPENVIATLAAGGRANDLNIQETVAHEVAYALASGRILPDASYQHAVSVLGANAVAELFFLVAGYSLLATMLNGFDVSAPENKK